MGNRFAEIAFTPAVLAQQEANGSRTSYARFLVGEPWNDRLGNDEVEFIVARDCPQDITPRFTLNELEQATQPLRERLAELEAMLASCEAQSAGSART